MLHKINVPFSPIHKSRTTTKKQLWGHTMITREQSGIMWSPRHMALMDRGRTRQENLKKADIGNWSHHITCVLLSWDCDKIQILMGQRENGKDLFSEFRWFKYRDKFIRQGYKESPEFTTSEVKHLYSPAISHICDAVSVVTTQQISEIYFQCFCGKLLNKSGHDLFLLLSAQ